MRQRSRLVLPVTALAAIAAATPALIGLGGAAHASTEHAATNHAATDHGAAATPAVARRHKQKHKPAAYTERTLTFTVTGIPNETTGKGKQTCTIVADVFKPKNASRHHRVPSILATNGFGGSKADQDALGMVAAEHGYGFLSYSGLGFGGSGCRVSLDDRSHDGKAGSQLVSWLGGDSHIKAVNTKGKRVKAPQWIIHDRRDHDGHKDRYDPRVGMIGGSYGGEIQYAIAGRDPRVDALIPIITWNNLTYSLAPNDLAGKQGFVKGVTENTPGTEKADWTSLFFGEGIADGAEGAKVNPTRDAGCPNFVQAACVAKSNLDSLGYPDKRTVAFATKASVASYIKKIKIPVLLAQGQADTLFDLQEAAATYHQLRHQGTPVKMIWQSWGHSDGTPAPGELIQGPGALQTYEGQRFFAWFNRYLKGHKHVSTGPRFAYYRDYKKYSGHGPDTSQYGTANHFPIGHAKKLFLSGSSSLVTHHSKVETGSASYANPSGGAPSSYSETSAVQGGDIPNQDTPPTDAPGTYAAWSTKPLSHRIDVAGISHATVSISCATCSDANPDTELQFFAKIYDIAPDGTINLVHRLIAPVRVANLSKPVKVQLPGIVHRFAKGDTIEFVLAATDAAYRNADVVQPATVTVGKNHPGVLKLPEVH